MANDDRTRQQQELDQISATIADMLPQTWQRLLENLQKEGFTKSEAMDLLKAYILGSSGARITPP